MVDLRLCFYQPDVFFTLQQQKKLIVLTPRTESITNEQFAVDS